MFLVSMLHVTLQYTISIVNRKSNPTWHFDDKSAFTLITPLAFSWPNLSVQPVVAL